MQNLETYVDRLIAEKGFNEKDPEILAQIKADLLSRIEDRVNALIVQELGDDKLEAFEEKLQAGNQDDIQKYIRENTSELDEKVAKELLAFRTIYLG